VEPVRTGVLGCGAVCQQYLPIVTRVAGLELLAVADAVPERAEMVGKEFGIPACLSPAELLENPAIELVINLTPITAHFETTSAALAAGKHVYSEKPLAASAGQAGELLRAAASAGRLLACAPDTLLGTGFSAARRALENGDIGTPLAAGAYMLRAPLGNLPAPMGSAFAFYDMAPYYLTALVNLFGPARQVTGFSQTPVLNGSPGDPAKNIVRGAAAIEFGTGITAQLSLVWGTNHRHEVPFIAVYGTDGELRLSNPNVFGEPALIRRYSQDAWREIPGSRQATTLPRNLRGLGAADLARAIRGNRPPAAHGELAAHVVEIIDGMISSARTGKHTVLSTTCHRAALLEDKEREELLEGVLVVA
jgi:predicted dehydrogenase